MLLDSQPDTHSLSGVPTTSTLIRKGHTTTQPFTSSHLFIDPAYIRAAEELKGKFVEIPTRELLDRLQIRDGPGMPTAQRGLQPLKELKDVTLENQSYDLFVRGSCSFAVLFVLIVP